GGLDKFIVKQCEKVLLQDKAALPKSFPVFLLQLKKDASQYMTFTPEERKAFVRRTREELGEWSVKLPSASETKKAMAKTGALTDTIYSLIPADKGRAFSLTKLKTAEDVLKYTPKWAVHKSSITPIAQCTNREEGYFILARINGISQMRQGPR